MKSGTRRSVLGLLVLRLGSSLDDDGKVMPVKFDAVAFITLDFHIFRVPRFGVPHFGTSGLAEFASPIHFHGMRVMNTIEEERAGRRGDCWQRGLPLPRSRTANQVPYLGLPESHEKTSCLGNSSARAHGQPANWRTSQHEATEPTRIANKFTSLRQQTQSATTTTTDVLRTRSLAPTEHRDDIQQTRK